jgi:hypothetical protein
MPRDAPISVSLIIETFGEGVEIRASKICPLVPPTRVEGASAQHNYFARTGT